MNIKTNHGAIMEKNKTINPFESEYCWDNREKALIFYHSEEFKKIFTDIIYEHFAFSVTSLEDLDSFFDEFHFSQYYVIYLDIDHVFNKLDEILTRIKRKYSRSKWSKIHFITSSIENILQIKKHDLPKNIIPLFQNGKEIEYIGGKKYAC